MYAIRDKIGGVKSFFNVLFDLDWKTSILNRSIASLQVRAR